MQTLFFLIFAAAAVTTNAFVPPRNSRVISSETNSFTNTPYENEIYASTVVAPPGK